MDFYSVDVETSTFNGHNQHLFIGVDAGHFDMHSNRFEASSCNLFCSLNSAGRWDMILPWRGQAQYQMMFHGQVKHDAHQASPLEISFTRSVEKGHCYSGFMTDSYGSNVNRPGCTGMGLEFSGTCMDQYDVWTGLGWNLHGVKLIR